MFYWNEQHKYSFPDPFPNYLQIDPTTGDVSLSREVSLISDTSDAVNVNFVATEQDDCASTQEDPLCYTMLTVSVRILVSESIKKLHHFTIHS